LLGFIFAYNLFFAIATDFGIESDVPLRSYDNVLVMTVFALCFFTLLFSLYIFCLLTGAVYFGIKLKKGHLSKQEFINVVFKGIYPSVGKKGCNCMYNKQIMADAQTARAAYSKR
jgi:hypothetical protein